MEVLAIIAERAPSCRVVKLEDEPSPPKVGRLLAARPDLRVLGGLGAIMLLEELRRGAVGTMTGFGFPELLVEIVTLVPGIDMGGVDFRLCGRSTTWSTSCVASWGGVGGTTAWYSKSLFTTHNRLGRYVRGMVMASGSGVVYKARLKVIYGILK